jgi:hypothetical protein
MDRGRSEGDLKRPSRGKVGQGDPEFAGQFDTNQLGAPIGVEFLHVAGLGHDLVGNGAPSAELIPRFEAAKTSLLEGPPDMPHRVVRQAEFEGDLGEFLSVNVTADDFMSNQHR